MIRICFILLFISEIQAESFLKSDGKNFLKHDNKNFQDLLTDKKTPRRKNHLSSDKNFLYDTRGKKKELQLIQKKDRFRPEEKLFWSKYFEEKDRIQGVRKR